MKSRWYAVLAVSFLSLTLSASAREMVLPAGTLLQCTMNEPNFSSSTVAAGDPVLCHLHSVTEFGQQAFPRGSYLVGHLESAQDPGHFWGKGNLKLQFDRIGLPNGDLPLDAKVIATRGYKVDKEGDIRGKGHAKRDIVEWLLPPLWPWKVLMLPARGPRPRLKGESMLTLRLMDDVQIPQVNATNGPDWHFFGRPQPQNESYYPGSSYGPRDNSIPRLAVRQVTPTASEPRVEEVAQVTYADYISKNAVGGGGTAPGAPVFMLKTGMVLAVGNYTYQNGRINYELASGGNGVISTDEVDWSTTTRVNSQRGVRVTLRGGHPSPGVTGF
ncbi:MAG TPA: hypothetical protein VEK84_15505 [Terriglobales bacterium]|nr:hypothetical protein [Terriglobales bacterium]